MPTADFNIGRDWTVDIMDPLQGGVQSFSLITGFSKQQNSTRVTSNGLDGITRIADLPDTWEGTITYDRASSALDDYFARVEQAWRDGLVMPPCTITETIREVGGGISQYRYEGVSLTFTNAGNAQGRDKVEQTVSFIASIRRKVI